jgi:hypothetical protein
MRKSHSGESRAEQLNEQLVILTRPLCLHENITPTKNPAKAGFCNL